MSGWNMPPGCTTLPGESKEEVEFERWLDHLHPGDEIQYHGRTYTIQTVDGDGVTIHIPFEDIERPE